MDISVIICTYNRAELLRHALDALIRQDVPGHLRWEVLVVNNNSFDSTPEVIAEFARKSPVPLISVFEKRQGLSYARNAGIAESRGAVVSFMDDDVIPAQDWVRTIVEDIHRHGADAIGGKILPKWSSPPLRWMMEDSGRHFLSRLALLDSEELQRASMEKPVRIYGANIAFRRGIFREIGDFNISLGRVGEKLYSHEEVELVERARAAGKIIVYDPKIVVWHHIPQERMRKRYFRQWSFDEGENEAIRLGHTDDPSVFGIPLRAFRLVIRDVLKWVKALIRRDPKAFRRETKLWYDLGFIRGRLQFRLKLKKQTLES